MNEVEEIGVCLVCEQGSATVPLLRLAYKGQTYWICPQHLPILIHDPSRLSGRLPGAESLEPSEHQG
jgi:hypothetical protein